MNTLSKTIGGLFIVGGFIALLSLLHAQETATLDQNVDASLTVTNGISAMTDLEVELNAIEMTTPLPATNSPDFGNFYSAQHAPGSEEEWPPLPADVMKLPVWPLGDGYYLFDDRNIDYDVLAVAQARTTRVGGMMPMDDSGGGGFSPLDLLSDTNLWLAITNLRNGTAGLFLSNTIADVQYEIQGATNLTQAQWVSEGFVFGSKLTNWTPTSVAATNQPTLFLRVRSWQDSAGSGLPDWWQLQYFGYIGVDPYGNPKGDGWNNLRKFQNGMDPFVFYTPAAPQGLTVAYNAASGVASISWQPALGSVTGYSVTDSAGHNFSVGASANTYSDNVPNVPNRYTLSGDPTVIKTYQIQATYSAGNSALSGTVPLEKDVLTASVISGATNNIYLTVSGIPADAVALYLKLANPDYDGIGDASHDVTHVISISAVTNGLFQLPASWALPVGDQIFWLQSSNAAGGLSVGAFVLNNWNNSDGTPTSFFDGRVQLKQNLIFQFRIADTVAPFGLEAETNYLGTFQDATQVENPVDYVYAGFYDINNYNLIYGNAQDFSALNVYLPFEDNELYQNFIYSSSNADSIGNMITGVEFDPTYETNIALEISPMYLPSINSVNLSPTLDTNQTRWLCMYPMDFIEFIYSGNSDIYLSLNGFYLHASDPATLTFGSYTSNYWGLPFVSAKLFYSNDGTHILNTVLNAGNSVTVSYSPNTAYVETAQPQFQTAEYDFWKSDANGNLPPMPGSHEFYVTNKSDLIIVGLGGYVQTIAAYQKLALVNGYSGVYGYLGQYLDKAYKLDANGNVTTNQTGVTSPYGSFFATDAGAAALVTMPDPDTGARGTCAVYCVSLALDKNHDGIMNTSFNGPDATSQASPVVWWINDDYDYSGASWDLGHDVQASWYYNDGYQQKIDSQRDLEDYARLWICGMPALTNGNYQVTLSWANVSSGNPTINLFDTVETNGGIGYLTNLDTATAEAYNYGIWGENRSAIATISPGHPFTIPASYFTNAGDKHFLFDGAITNGAGELMLTIADGNGNTIAQTGAWLDLHDVKDFYERAVITNNVSSSAISNWTSGVEIVQQATASALGDDTNLIVMVHGINVGDWDWQSQSDTVFKRLYWAGYRGKFMTVKWPCDYLTPPQPVTFDVFNLSEANAYKASTALTTYLNQLRSRFPGYRLNLFVHSQGNAVVSEAIKNGAPFDTYILTQGAISDGAYDMNATNYPAFVNQEVGTHITPEWQPMGYRGIYTNSNFTGKIVNFYNPQDGVLAIWQTDQIDDKPSGYYSYDGTNCWYTDFFFISHLVTDFQETRSMVSRSRSLSVGQSGPASAHGVIQSAVDLNANFGFNSDISEHSAQWTRPIQTSLPYYNQLLLQIKPLQ
jgi:hypothetical protein